MWSTTLAGHSHLTQIGFSRIHTFLSLRQSLLQYLSSCLRFANGFAKDVKCNAVRFFFVIYAMLVYVSDGVV